MSDRFEQEFKAWMETEAEPSSRHIDALVRFARLLPARERRRPRVFAFAGSIAAAIAFLAVVMVVGSTALPPAASPTPPAASPTPSAGSPAPTPTDPGTSPSPSPSPTGTPAARTPVLYYDSVSRGRVALYRVVLEGAARPELVLERAIALGTEEAPYPFVDVAPDGSVALVWTRDASDQWSIEAVELATGSTRWSSPVPPPDRRSKWSRDARYAVTASYPDDSDEVTAVHIDAAAGVVRTRASRLPIHGIEAGGSRVILIEERGDARFEFRRWDPAADTVEPVTVEDARVDETGYTRVSVVLGASVELDHPDLGGDPVGGVLRDVETGAEMSLVEGFLAIRALFFDATGERVLGTFWEVGSGREDPGVSRLYLHVPGQAATLLWEASPAFVSEDEIAHALEGDLVAVRHQWDEPDISVIEIATGRSVTLPVGSGAGIISVSRIIGGAPLGTVTPSPEPSPSPAPTAGPPLQGAAQLVTHVVEELDGGGVRARLSVVGPAGGGGIAVLHEQVFPIEGVSPEEAWVETNPVPGSGRILVGIGPRGNQRYWSWDPDGDLRELALSTEFEEAEFTDALVSSPDGLKLAALVGPRRAVVTLFNESLLDDGGSEIRTAGSVEVPPGWQGSYLAGWLQDGSEVILWRSGGIDTCSVRGPALGILDVTDGSIRAYRPDAPEDAVGSGSFARSISVASGYVADRISDDSLRLRRDVCGGGDDDIDITLPTDVRTVNPSLPWSIEGHRLYVLAIHGDEQVLLHYDEPYRDPDREPLRTPVDYAVLEVDSISPDGRWARVFREEVVDCDAVGLMEIATGAVWWTTCETPLVQAQWMRP